MLPVEPPADVRRVAEALRAEYARAFDLFLDAAIELEGLERGDQLRERSMNFADGYSRTILELIRIEAKIANYEHRGLTGSKDYARQCRFRVRENDFLSRRRADDEWCEKGGA